MTKALMANTATDLAGGDDGAGGTNGACRRRSRAGAASTSATCSTARRARSRDQTTVFKATRQRLDLLLQRRQRGEAAAGDAGLDRRGRPDDRQLVRQRPRPRGDGGRRRPTRATCSRAAARSPAAPPTRATTSRTCSCPRAVSRRDQGAGDRDQHRGRRRARATPTRPTRTTRCVVSNVGAPLTSRRGAHRGHRARSRRAATATAYFEPGEPFTVRQNLRNVGNATATAISRHADRLGRHGDRPARPRGRTWRPTPPATNTAAFGATVSPSAACGVAAGAHVDVTSSAGPFNDPVHGAASAGRATTTITRTVDRRAEGDPGQQRRRASPRRLVGERDGRPRQRPRRHDRPDHPHVRRRPRDRRSPRPQGTTVRLANRNGGSRRQLHQHGVRRRGRDGDLGRRRPVHRQLPALPAAVGVRRPDDRRAPGR